MRWSPDTCKCVFDFDPDPNDDSNQILTEVINRCSDHDGLNGNALHQTVLKGENQAKNKLHAKLLQIEEMAEDVVKDDGSIIRQFKKGVSFDWSFSGKDDARSITIITKGYKLTPQQIDTVSEGKATIQ